jgi:anthranilate phosphoribosyltransferase
MLNPGDIGFERLSSEALSGGKTAEDAARIFMNVLNNEATSAQTQAGTGNAAMALLAAGRQLPSRRP